MGDSDFNMVLSTNSIEINASSSIAHIAENISETGKYIFENAENISNYARDYSEIIKGEKIVTATSINQISQENTNIKSNGDTEIDSDGTSVVNGGNNVLING